MGWYWRVWAGWYTRNWRHLYLLPPYLSSSYVQEVLLLKCMVRWELLPAEQWRNSKCPYLPEEWAKWVITQYSWLSLAVIIYDLTLFCVHFHHAQLASLLLYMNDLCLHWQFYIYIIYIQFGCHIVQNKCQQIYGTENWILNKVSIVVPLFIVNKYTQWWQQRWCDEKCEEIQSWLTLPVSRLARIGRDPNCSPSAVSCFAVIME